MNCTLRNCGLLTMAVASGCVLSEPVGNTPEAGSTNAAETSGTTTVVDDTTGEPATGSTSLDETTGGPDATGTSEETGVPDTGGDPEIDECLGEHQELFTWNWSFGGYEPALRPDAGRDDADAFLPLNCGVANHVEGFDQVTLLLDCQVDGASIPDQALTLSPLPEALVSELDAGNPVSLEFRPHNACGFGCGLSDGGRLSIRRSEDDAVLVGIIDVHRIASPLEMLAPLSVEITESSSCPQIFERRDNPICTSPDLPWVHAYDVTVSDANANATVTGTGFGSWQDYSVIVNQANDGSWGGCVADGGDRARVRVMVLRRPG